jgi:AraC-like DNA-binding protein
LRLCNHYTAGVETFSSTLIDGGFYVCTPAWHNYAGLYSDYHRLYFPESGTAEFTLSGRVWRMKPGRIYLLPGYQLARFHCRERMTLHWLHFRVDAVEMDSKVAQFKEGMSWPAKEWAYWKPVYSHLLQLFKSRTQAQVYRTQAMLTWLCSELIERASHETFGAGHVQPAHAVNDGIEYIHQNFLDNPSLNEIAASVHLSPIYFHRCFSQAFHLTPHEYLTRKRMHFAWDLLRGGASVAETARRLKFGTSFYFSRAFKRFFGTTPIQVRLGKVQHPP